MEFLCCSFERLAVTRVEKILVDSKNLLLASAAGASATRTLAVFCIGAVGNGLGPLKIGYFGFKFLGFILAILYERES